MILLDSKRKEKFADLGKEGDVLKISFYFFFFFQYWVWTQYFVFASLALYYLSHISSPIFFFLNLWIIDSMMTTSNNWRD
jgi:hypothetical protein